MSELCLYELEDTVWDELYQSDDHIVPHPGYKQADDHPILSDSHKKHRREVTCSPISDPDRYDARHVDQGRDHGGFPSVSKRRNTMLEKDSWSDAPTGVFPPSSDSDSIKEVSSLASENTPSSSHVLTINNGDSNSNEFCGKDNIPGDKTTTVDNNSFSYPLGDIAHAGNNLDLFENTEDNDSSDFLYYGWPEIGNFEDVDRMFRNCESTFGLGACKEDEVGWFPSADDIGGSVDIMNSDCKFSSPESNRVGNRVENSSQNHDSSKGCSMNDSAMTSESMRHKGGSWISDPSDSYMSFVNEPTMENGKAGFIPKKQIEENKKQVKLLNLPVGESEELQASNSCISCISDLPNEVAQLPTGANSDHALGQDSCNYLQNHLSYLNSDNNPQCDLTSVKPTSPAVKTETKELTSPSPRDSCHASNQVQSIEGNPGSVGKQVYCSEDKFENHTDIEGVSDVIPAELDPSNVQESTTVSSGVHDISLEAASFRQLQLVMEQLDLRTKICIRDSLYRLAQSAEQRHNHANSNGSCGDERDASGALMAERKNNFVDIETDTNPIDRSIAHLLFHRPLDSSAVPAHDSSAVKKLLK